jgi:hypothetical protein
LASFGVNIFLSFGNAGRGMYWSGRNNQEGIAKKKEELCSPLFLSYFFDI